MIFEIKKKKKNRKKHVSSSSFSTNIFESSIDSHLYWLKYLQNKYIPGWASSVYTNMP